jgi:sulfur carrier protein ThiS
MPVKIIYRKEEFEFKPGLNLWDALKKIDVLPETVIATREGSILTEDEILGEDYVINLIDVISGGNNYS